MRMTYFILFMILFFGVVVFAAENRELMTLKYFDQSVSCPRWAMIAIVYLVGMASGCVAFLLLRRSLRPASPGLLH